MFEDDFYTIDDAAKWLTKRRDREVSSKDIYRRVKSGELPICFMFDGLLSGVTIHKPRESDTQPPIELVEWVNPDIPFSGTVKSLVFKGDDNSLEATLVSIIALDGVPMLRGHVLPVTKHPFKIKPGYEVHGMLNYLEVPRSDWLFSIDDLHKLVAKGE